MRGKKLIMMLENLIASKAFSNELVTIQELNESMRNADAITLIVVIVIKSMKYAATIFDDLISIASTGF